MSETHRSILFAGALLALVVALRVRRDKARRRTAAIVGLIRANATRRPPVYDEMGMGPGGRRAPIMRPPTAGHP